MKNILIVSLLIIQCTAVQCNTIADKHLIGVNDFSIAIQSKQDEIQLIDVRTPEEFQQGHIPDAQNIDWRNADDFNARISALNKSKPIYLYCMSGGRSAAAAEKLLNEGFEVYELEGGILSWRNSELPESNQPSALKGLNMEQYKKLLNEESLVLIDFYAKWCVPCKQMKPYFDNISTDMSDRVKIIRIDIDENPQLAKALKIKALPLIKLYQSNQLIWENVGYIDEAGIRSKLK